MSKNKQMLTEFFLYTVDKKHKGDRQFCYLSATLFSVIHFEKVYFRCNFTIMIPPVCAVKHIYINENQILGLFILILKKSKDHCLFIFLNTTILSCSILTHPF